MSAGDDQIRGPRGKTEGRDRNGPIGLLQRDGVLLHELREGRHCCRRDVREQKVPVCAVLATSESRLGCTPGTRVLQKGHTGRTHSAMTMARMTCFWKKVQFKGSKGSSCTGCGKSWKPCLLRTTSPVVWPAAESGPWISSRFSCFSMLLSMLTVRPHSPPIGNRKEEKEATAKGETTTRRWLCGRLAGI